MPRIFDQSSGNKLERLRRIHVAENDAADYADALSSEEQFSHEHKMVLCLSAIVRFEYHWFRQEFDAAPDQYMVRLLLGIYLCNLWLSPISKKDAWQMMGVADIKTSRKYVQEAQLAELVRPVRSTEDKRVELLRPTPKLMRLVEIELHILKAQSLHLVERLSKPTSGDAKTTPGTEKRKNAGTGKKRTKK